MKKEDKKLYTWIEDRKHILELRYKRKNLFNYNNTLKVKHKNQFIVKLKTIKYQKEIFCYLSF